MSMNKTIANALEKNGYDIMSMDIDGCVVAYNGEHILIIDSAMTFESITHDPESMMSRTEFEEVIMQLCFDDIPSGTPIRHALAIIYAREGYDRGVMKLKIFNEWRD